MLGHRPSPDTKMRHRPRHAWAAAAFALAALCAAVSAAAPPAGAQPKPPPTDWPIRANSAAAGGFAAAQFATADAAQFVADWARPTPGVTLHGTTRIGRNHPIDTFITFRGCRADPAGRCDVTATFELRDPSGKIVPIPTVDIWAHQPQPPPGVIQLSRASMAMTFNGSDALGIYIVRAAITDHVAGVTLHTQQEITVSN
jgi:hypothetical protein